MNEPKTKDDLIAYLRGEEDSAREFQRQELQPDRERNLAYFLGRKNGHEEEGRSQVISSDVWDAVQGMLPALLKPFTSTDEFVKFSPVNAEDEAGAEQETDYLNYIVSQKNNGYMLFSTWFADALLNKYGIVEYGWEESEATAVEKYRGLNDDELAMLMQSPGVTIEEQSSYPDPIEPMPQMPDETGMMPPPMQPPMVYDVTVRVTNKTGQAKIHNIPPEEFVYNADLASHSIKDATFVQREVFKTISQVRELGYEVEDDISDDGEDFYSYSERSNRNDNYRTIQGQQGAEYPWNIYIENGHTPCFLRRRQ